MSMSTQRFRGTTKRNGLNMVLTPDLLLTFQWSSQQVGGAQVDKALRLRNFIAESGAVDVHLDFDCASPEIITDFQKYTSPRTFARTPKT